MEDVPLQLRMALAGRHDVEREAGSGGMATVYLAGDLRHHCQVAVKVLRPELAASLGAERFLREIRIAAQLSHPHIVPLLDSGEAAGLVYYVMPFVEGESLRARLERERTLPHKGGIVRGGLRPPLPPDSSYLGAPGGRSCSGAHRGSAVLLHTVHRYAPIRLRSCQNLAGRPVRCCRLRRALLGRPWLPRCPRGARTAGRRALGQTEGAVALGRRRVTFRCDHRCDQGRAVGRADVPVAA